METFRHQKSTSSERFLGLYSNHQPASTAPAAAAHGAAGDFDEGDMFLTSSVLSAADSHYPSSSSSSYPPLRFSTLNPKPTSAPQPQPSGSPRRVLEKTFGILAALPEDDKTTAIRNSTFLHRKASISSSSSSPSTSPSSLSRIIPPIPKSKSEYSFSMPVGKMMQQSAPVSVPLRQRMERRFGDEPPDDDYGDEDEMLPPHEIVARASAKESHMTTFSVLEGAGRTLKGSDLRRVRNAVWRQTGFLD